MGADTKIAWCDDTVNLWVGCNKVGPGCLNCYAEARAKRFYPTLELWGPGTPRLWCHGWRGSLRKLHRRALREGRRRVVFINSQSDFFEENRSLMYQQTVKSDDVPDGVEKLTEYVRARYGMQREVPLLYGGFSDPGGTKLVSRVCRVGEMLIDPFRGAGSFLGDYRFASLDDLRVEAFEEFDQHDQLLFMLLTKRPQNVELLLPVPANGRDPSDPEYRRRDNLLLGTSVACEDDLANVYSLANCRPYASKLFVSIEPLVERVDLSGVLGIELDRDGSWRRKSKWCADPLVDWVIVGGESGPGARPCHVEWIEYICQQCEAAGVPVFVKQLGEKSMRRVYGGPAVLDGGVGVDRVSHVFRNKFVDRKGGDPAEWPERLQRWRQTPWSEAS